MVLDTLGSMGNLTSPFSIDFFFIRFMHRMKEHAANTVSDEDFSKRAERWPKDTPDTKEAYFIRDIFDSLFPSATAAETAVR